MSTSSDALREIVALKTFRQIAAEQVRDLRKHRGVSQQGLADRMNLYGAQIDRTAVAKVEAGKRDVPLAEAFVFALALDVAPVHFLVPIDASDAIQVAPGFSAGPNEVRAWIRGYCPLLQDPRVYFSTVPQHEFAAADSALTAWQRQAAIAVSTTE